MTPLARAIFRALISMLHPRMLFLAVWPFLLSVLFWGIIGWLFKSAVLSALHELLFGLTLIQWVEGTFHWFGIGWLLEWLVPLVYLTLLLSLAVATALFIIGTLAMPIIVDHVAARHHPTLERRYGGGVWYSLANTLVAAVIFLLGWIITMPLWLFLPLAVLLPWCWWGWLSYRILSYDALAQHASQSERAQLVDLHRPRLLALGMVVAAFNFVPPLFFLAPIYGGLAFTHYTLEALERLRRPSEVARKSAADAIGHMTLETGS
jgi:hypothetical protein